MLTFLRVGRLGRRSFFRFFRPYRRSHHFSTNGQPFVIREQELLFLTIIALITVAIFISILIRHLKKPKLFAEIVDVDVYCFSKVVYLDSKYTKKTFPIRVSRFNLIQNAIPVIIGKDVTLIWDGKDFKTCRFYNLSVCIIIIVVVFLSLMLLYFNYFLM